MEDLDTPQKRLELFIKNQFKTKKEFADAMGMIASDVSKYTGNGKSIFSTIQKERKLSSLGLNINWYKNGEGEMLKNVEVESNVSEINTAKLVSVIDISNMTIDQLREYKKTLDKELQIKTNQAEKIDKILKVIDGED